MSFYWGKYLRRRESRSGFVTNGNNQREDRYGASVHRYVVEAEGLLEDKQAQFCLGNGSNYIKVQAP